MTALARRMLVSLLAMLAAVILLVPGALAQDDAADHPPPTDGPRPGAIGEPAAPVATRHVYDMANLLSPDQEAWVEADATRLRRFGLPVVVIIQFNDLSADDAAAFAAEVRRQWQVESEPGAEDGLVMLISVPTAGGAISSTLAWGDGAFPNDGLDAPAAERIEADWLDARIEGGQLYEGILFSLRRMIYHSIYDPPPATPLSTPQRVRNVGTDVLAPVLALGGIVAAAMALRSRYPHRALSSPVLVWGVPAVALAVAVGAIWSRSGWGAASAIVLLAVAAFLWVRRDPERVSPTGARQAGGSTPGTSARSRAWLALPALLFVLSLALNLNDVPTTEFHPDESRWLNRANYFPDILDPFGPTWADQYLTRGQPPLGSYLMGLGLLLQGRDTDTNGVWNFSYGTDWNELNGAVPEPADLDAGRRTNAVVAAITVVLVFFIGTALFGTIAGAAGGLLLATHPLHIWIGSQALSDQLLILLIALTVLTAVHLGRRPSRGKALALGILLGLGGGAKLSPLVLAIPIALYGVGLLLLARWGLADPDRARRLVPLLAIQPLITAIVFVVSYPYLWPAPLERTINLFELRANEMESQASAWPDVAIAHPGEALLRIYDRLTWQFSATGNLAEGVLGRFGVQTDVWGIDLVLAVAGVGVLAWLVVRRGLTSGTALAAFVLAGQMGGIVVGMQVDFYRYHLPITLGVAILTGLAAQAAWDAFASHAAETRRNTVRESAGQPIQSGSQ